ncbi:MAG TPA: sensory rhodopsin transducer [Phycisphaerae bacterium]|nr:sensory rhodopsin transducer [Phycisphaerales bacterium]HRX84950.1 sensory rhodopsin transducer [Phycisphaerae bacterium]
MELGARQWVIAEGYLPAWSHGPEPEMKSHGAVCILNAGDKDAHIEITIYYADRAPVGPYREIVPAQRTRHIRFNSLKDPEEITPGIGFSSVIAADVPVVVQYTRLDSRQAENALMTTMAYAAAP